MQKNPRTAILICTHTTFTEIKGTTIKGFSIYRHRLRRSSLCTRQRKSDFIKSLYLSIHLCCSTGLTLKLVEDQTNQAFLGVFRRFISRRGVPECIISDNAKTFKAGAQELQTMKNQVLKPNASQQFLANNNITWKFITERAPCWGGFYERLVKLVKRRLKKTIGKAYLNMIELNTILIEVAAVLNSHPLTYPYVDINDASPLIPSHFLCGHRLLTLPDTRVSVKESDPDYISTDVSTKELTKRGKYHEIVIQAFWTRWQKEYLTSLREYNSYQNKDNSCNRRRCS